MIVVISNLVPKPFHEDSYLESPTGNQEVESNGGPTMGFQEGHEEAEANEDHHMDVLEHGVLLLHQPLRHSIVCCR